MNAPPDEVKAWLTKAKNEAFDDLREKAELLGPFALEIRYPGDASEVSHEDAKEAYAAAHAIWEFVLDQLPPSVRP